MFISVRLLSILFSEGQGVVRCSWLMVFTGLLFAQFEISVQPAISQESWKLSYINKIKPTANLLLAQRSDIFNIDHSFDRYIWYSYSRNNISLITHYSYFEVDNNAYSIKLGRDYLSVGPGKMAGLFISPVSPALDHINFTLKEYYGFHFSDKIIRLDNREKLWDQQSRIVQRWYYLRSFGYNYRNILQFTVYDAVIATGFNRSLEWYYLNPFSSLFIERKHQMHWREGSDTTTVIGQGDNDNHFIGGSLRLNLQSWDIYGELLIDEWQLTKESRNNMQTVFGLLFGLEYQMQEWDIALEYSLSSPWLYLNRALYGSPEYHGLPLGMRSPQAQCLDLFTQYNFSGDESFLLQIHLEQRGSQSLSTSWNGWDNKVDVFDFNRTMPVEVKLLYTDSEGKYFNTLGLYHNWLQSGTTQLMLGWNFNKTL